MQVFLNGYRTLYLYPHTCSPQTCHSTYTLHLFTCMAFRLCVRTYFFVFFCFLLLYMYSTHIYPVWRSTSVYTYIYTCIYVSWLIKHFIIPAPTQQTLQQVRCGCCSMGSSCGRNVGCQISLWKFSCIGSLNFVVTGIYV